MEDESANHSTPVHKAVQVEVASQLRSAVLALRDSLFELQDLATNLKDVAYDLNALVLKIEETLVRTSNGARPS